MKMLPYAHFRPVYLREVHPAGWIQDFLETQVSGLTGHPEASGYPYGIPFWGSALDDTHGSYAAWWPYEQTAYWIDGALKCGFLAEDDPTYQKALAEVNFAVEHAAADGFIGPQEMREKDRWPYAVFFRAVLAQYEISGDPTYLRALARHYLSCPHPMLWDRDVTGVEILVNLVQELAGEPSQPADDLLNLAEDLFARFNARFPLHDCALESLLSDKKSSEHGVTFNELGKLGALLYSAIGSPVYLEAAVNGYAKLDRDQLLADGLHSCSEHLRGKDPRDSHELCDVTDHTWSLAYLLQATGQASYADRIEQVIFNALPGHITKDFKALQYFSCPNQVIADAHSNHNLFLRGFNWMSFRPDHEVQCCPGNLHRAMPNFVARMWLRAPDGGIAAALFGPGRLDTSAGGTPLKITSHTRYPFEQAVIFTFEPEKPVSFPFLVRVPAWCSRPALSLNGKPLEADLQPGSFYTLQRLWRRGDTLRVDLPFDLSLQHWPGGGISLAFGPLTLALPVRARSEAESENSTDRQRRLIHASFYVERPYTPPPGFPARNLTPASPWNYALDLDEDTLLERARVEWNPSGQPFDAENPVLKVKVPARRVKRWQLVRVRKVRQFANWVEDGKWRTGVHTLEGDFRMTPPLPDPAKLPGRLGEIEEIELVPYGATLLRMTIFPQVKR